MNVVVPIMVADGRVEFENYSGEVQDRRAFINYLRGMH